MFYSDSASSSIQDSSALAACGVSFIEYFVCGDLLEFGFIFCHELEVIQDNTKSVCILNFLPCWYYYVDDIFDIVDNTISGANL